MNKLRRRCSGPRKTPKSLIALIDDRDG